MLSNAYFLAKFRFDIAENEPAKNLQNFRKAVAARSCDWPRDDPGHVAVRPAGCACLAALLLSPTPKRMKTEGFKYYKALGM